MSTRSKIAVWATAAAVVVGLGVLATPAVAGVVEGVESIGAGHTAKSHPTTAVAGPTAEPSPTDVPKGYVYLGQGLSVPAGGPGNCTTTSWINLMSVDRGPIHATLLGPDLIDMGPSGYAQGTVGRDDQGRITTYTVAPGDALYAIGDRFCIGDATMIGELNHRTDGTAIQPGDVLVLRPGPTAPWTDYDILPK